MWKIQFQELQEKHTVLGSGAFLLSSQLEKECNEIKEKVKQQNIEHNKKMIALTKERNQATEELAKKSEASDAQVKENDKELKKLSAKMERDAKSSADKMAKLEAYPFTFFESFILEILQLQTKSSSPPRHSCLPKSHRLKRLKETLQRNSKAWQLLTPN